MLLSVNSLNKKGNFTSFASNFSWHWNEWKVKTTHPLIPWTLVHGGQHSWGPLGGSGGGALSAFHLARHTTPTLHRLLPGSHKVKFKTVQVILHATVFFKVQRNDSPYCCCAKPPTTSTLCIKCHHHGYDQSNGQGTLEKRAKHPQLNRLRRNL